MTTTAIGIKQVKAQIRGMTRGMYDLQKLRIQCGLRLVAATKVRLGQEPGKKETELSADAKRILQDLRERFERITDGTLNLPKPKDFTGDDLISDYSFASLVANYLRLNAAEEQQRKELGWMVEIHPLWDAFLKGVKGVGPAMAGVLISEIDVHKMRHISSVWRFAGLDVGPDGRGRGKYREHLVKVQYETKDGNTAERDSITYNPFLKTKLFVLGGQIIKAGRKNNPYVEIYYGLKHRYENHAKYGEHNDGKKDENGRFITSKMRRHMMAMRGMIKQLLKDLVLAWGQVEGVDFGTDYAEGKLGRKHTAA